MTPGATPCRVLIVEDEMMIVVLIEEALKGLGYEVVATASKLEAALQLVHEGQFDIAILDVSIRGEKVYPVADLLLERGIPFALASGYGDWALPEALRDRPRLMKPFTIKALQNLARELCRQMAR